MVSEEYVEQVNRLMDLQTTYLNIFLVFLGFVIAIMLALQWWLNSKQMKQIKELTKQETIKQVEKSLGVSSLEGFTKDLQRNIEDIEKRHDTFESNQLEHELNKVYEQETIPLWHITFLMDIYKSYILKNLRSFDYTVSKIASLIFFGINEKRVDIKNKISNDHIDGIIRKMSEFENIINEKSASLEKFRNEIKFYRSQEKEK